MKATISSTDRAAYVTLGLLGVVAGIAAIVLLSLFVEAMPTTHATGGVLSDKVALTIVAQRADSAISGPSYVPSTDLVLPAHTLVTVTIVNQDLGDTPLPAGSPFSNVAGTSGGVAFVDGQAYRSLDTSKVAHTFSIPQLGINVPIPGDVPQGHQGVTVTFTFLTGNAGTYLWRCMDPCGAGQYGWGGPMSMAGYMEGTLTLE